MTNYIIVADKTLIKTLEGNSVSYQPYPSNLINRIKIPYVKRKAISKTAGNTIVRIIPLRYP